MKSLGWPGHYRWLLPILLLAFLLRIAYLDAQSLWWDEAFSFSMSVVDLRSLLANAVHYRVHPPLYYTLMHFWLGVGHSEFLLRFLSILCGMVSVSIMYHVAALVGGKKVAILASLLLAVSPFNVWYSQETRMYSVTTMLVLAACASFLRLLRRDTLRNWVAYGLFSLLAMYSDYLQLFIILAQALFLIILRETYRSVLRKWFCCMAVVGSLFLPWVVSILAKGGFYSASISWIPPATIADPFWTIYNFSLGSTSNPDDPLNFAAALLFIALAVYGLVSLRSKPTKEQHSMAFVAAWLLLPLVLTFLISLDWPLPQKRSIYIDRFFNPLLPAFLILTSVGIYRALSKKKVIGLAALIVVFVPTTTSLYGLFFEEAYARDQWRQAIAHIRENAQSDDVLLVRPHHYVPLYYYDLHEITWHTVPYLASKEEYETSLSTEVSPLLGNGARLWTMIVCENADTHRFVQGARQRLMEKVENDEIRAWLLENYQLVEDTVYNGIYLASYGGG